MAFTIAIVGRPNVGKSTLFNRLAGKKLALVDDQPGVTRDRREAEGRLGDLNFKLIDTAGLEEEGDNPLSARMKAQTEAAILDADLALMVIDARAGLTPIDRHFCDWARAFPTPTLLVANKCEGKASEAGLLEAFALGLGAPIALSAEHGDGMAELYQEILPYVEALGAGDDVEEGADKPLMLAVVGRPNAGKSTLINHMIGKQRLVTGPEAGITRDAIAVDWVWEGHNIRLVDTAGLRRRAKVQGKLEKLSVHDSRRAVQFAEVVVVLIDASLGIETQDLKIAAEVEAEGRALVIALNKWDLVDDPRKSQATARDVITRSFAQLKDVPIVMLSAITGAGVAKLMPTVLRVHQAWNKRVATARLNRWLGDAVAEVPPPSVKGKRCKIRYVTQIKTRPPTFAFFLSRADELPEAYRRYLVNSLREHLDFAEAPIRVLFRGGENPFVRP